VLQQRAKRLLVHLLEQGRFLFSAGPPERELDLPDQERGIALGELLPRRRISSHAAANEVFLLAIGVIRHKGTVVQSTASRWNRHKRLEFIKTGQRLLYPRMQ